MTTRGELLAQLFEQGLVPEGATGIDIREVPGVSADFDLGDPAVSRNLANIIKANEESGLYLEISVKGRMLGFHSYPRRADALAGRPPGIKLKHLIYWTGLLAQQMPPGFSSSKFNKKSRKRGFYR